MQEAAHQLLNRVVPTTPEGCDLLLDLRDLLISKGHAGKCVSCFFGLLGDLDQPVALTPLKHWLEEHLEIAVYADQNEVDTVPVRLEESDNLESFCHRTIRTVQQDRALEQERLNLRVRYKTPV